MTSCFQLINLEYFENIIVQINNIGTAEELQALVNQLYAQISLMESTLTAQLDLVLPLELLVEPPTNLSSVINFITAFQNDFIRPLMVPIVSIQAQLVAIPAQMVEVAAAITAVAESKFP